MQTRVSTKGQVVLPGQLRRRLGIAPGDDLDVRVETGSIVLTPRIRRSAKAQIITDPLTGLPALSLGPDAPKLSSRDVEELLSNFP